MGRCGQRWGVRVVVYGMVGEVCRWVIVRVGSVVHRMEIRSMRWRRRDEMCCRRVISR